METLIAELETLSKGMRVYLRNRTGDAGADRWQQKWQAFALKWKAKVALLTPQERKDLVNAHILALHEAHKVLVGDEISHGHKMLVPLFRGPCDIIFGSLHIKRPYVKFRRIPTRVFTEFVKGITYFRTDANHEWPIYHRLNSCGSGELDVKKKFRRKQGYSNDAGMDNRARVRTCYIERLIYDKIFSAILFRQNVAHLHELQDMERLHDDLYPGVQLQVHVGKFVGTNPTYVSIIDQNTKDEEIYEKEPESNIVRCSKIEGGAHFHKMQTFERATPWLPGPLPPKTFAQRIAHLKRPLSI